MAAPEKAVSLNRDRAESYLSLANAPTFLGRSIDAVEATRMAICLYLFIHPKLSCQYKTGVDTVEPVGFAQE